MNQKFTIKLLYEQFCIAYYQRDNYVILNFTILKKNNVGIYNQKFLNYLQVYHKLTYINFLISGIFNKYIL